MPKFFLTIVMIALLNSSGYGQKDTLIIVTDTSENDIDNPVYKPSLNQNEIQIKYLWKVHLTGMGLFAPGIGYERKIGKSWSSDTYLMAGFQNTNYRFQYGFQWEISQQLKFYYNLRRREKMGKKSNGFSANYISLGLYAGEQNSPKPEQGIKTSIVNNSWLGIGMRYGMQRRIGNVGFFEPYIGLRYHYRYGHDHEYAAVFNYPSNNHKEYYLEFGIKAGFAFQSDLMPYAEAYEPGRSKLLWKLNLVDFGLLSPNFAVEYRLSNNWSGNTYFKFGVESTDYVNYAKEIEQQIRLYPQLISGKNKKAFSGNYLSFALFFESRNFRYYLQDDQSLRTKTVTANLLRYGAGVRFGYQQRICNIGYFDMYAGVDYRVQDEPGISNMPDDGYFYWELNKDKSRRFVPVLGIKAGFAIGSGGNVWNLIK